MKNFLLILLIIIIIGGTGCAVYYQIDSFNKKNEEAKSNNQQEEKQEKVKELDVNSEQVTNLMKNLNVVNDYLSTGEQLQGYLYLKDQYDKNEIVDNIKLLIGLNSLDLKNRFQKGNTDELGTVTLTSEEVRSTIKNIFGPTVIYNDVTKMDACAVGSIAFNTQSNSYFIIEPSCGGVLNPFYKTKVISAKKYSDRIELEEKAIFIKPNGEDSNNITYNIYKPNKTDVIAEIVNLANDSEDEYSQYFDKTNTYKYTFKLENNNYYFESVEKIS